jgi:hypothetical protein
MADVIVPADTLRSIMLVPELQGALIPGLPRDLSQDEDQSDDEESLSAPEIASVKLAGTLH